jgi:hypothetical protein
MSEHEESRSLTRSGLLKAGALAALVVGSGGAGAAMAGGAAAAFAGAGGSLDPSRIGRPKGGPAYLDHATYVPLVGSDFRLYRPGARTLRLQLIEARVNDRSPGETFSLLFRAHARASVDARMYLFEHPALGSFELFVSPVNRGVHGLDLEAVINRIAT